MVNIVFLHPDLGIGGAERLVVDAAVALAETIDGTLPVTVVGDWLPRTIFGRFYALFSYIRMIYAAFYFIFSSIQGDVVFCDQVSVCIPVLYLKVKYVIFYCHFPDQLLSKPGNMFKRLYRMPLNWLEEKTTAMANVILVNSEFTKQIFRHTFRSITVVPKVLHPSINTRMFDKVSVTTDCDGKSKITFLSINRFERKKKIETAINAFHRLKMLSNEIWQNAELVICGGYDPLVPENAEYLRDLKELTLNLEVDGHVKFYTSVSDDEKIRLLKKCNCVLYTPENEHFGIVPLEAMYCEKPVIAFNSGGPMETIDNGKTGFLCKNSNEFADAMFECTDLNTRKIMGKAAHERFNELFSFEIFSEVLNNIVLSCCERKK